MIDLSRLNVWFVLSSQSFYAEAALPKVTNHCCEMVRILSASVVKSVEGGTDTLLSSEVLTETVTCCDQRSRSVLLRRHHRDMTSHGSKQLIDFAVPFTSACSKPGGCNE